MAGIHMTTQHANLQSPEYRRYIAEFIGTLSLTCVTGYNVLSGRSVFGGLNTAVVLMVLTYAFKDISGAHFNPAISLSLGLVRTLGGDRIGMPWRQVCIYCIVQVLAGLLAGQACKLFFSQDLYFAPAKGFQWLHAGLCEVGYTFMLSFVFLNVCTAKKVNGNKYYGLAMGLVLIAGAYGAGVVSGACLNPAIAIGLDAAGATVHTHFGWCIAYMLFELLGALRAALLFKMIRPDEFGFILYPDAIIAQFVSEFAGAFMFVLTVGLNILGNSSARALSAGAALVGMTYALRDVSGAHFNPAVTFAIFLANADISLTWRKATVYAVAQTVGGVFGALVYTIIYRGQTFSMGPHEGFNWVQVAAVETLFTMLLCLVVLSMTFSGEKRFPEMYGLTIGSCVIVGGFAIGKISGAELNPALTCAVAVSNLLAGGSMLKLVIYSTCQMVGGALAACIVKLTHSLYQKM